ncbi:MAG: sulfatase-like hydrolase/transferase [Fuerstiella sp.]
MNFPAAILLTGLSLVLFPLVLFPPVVAASGPPDVLMIMVDDLRPLLGCYGVDRIRTPNIDRLAARSVVFNRAYGCRGNRQRSRRQPVCR